MHNAAAYIRVSTDDQTEYSPEAQLRAIREYCAKNGYCLDPAFIYKDEGYSGRKAEKRPAFMKMIGAAKQKPAPFEAILCHKFDRFARNREDSVVYKSLLHKECGVKVISITESVENDKFGLIMESMLEAMAEYYSINLGEEVKKGMTEKARRGEPLSIAPFGYRMEEKRLVPVVKEADAVRKIFADFIGGKSQLEIARGLSGAGFLTHRGNKFENRTVDYILHNPVYAGFIRWTPSAKIRRDFCSPDSMIVKGGHTPLIGADLFLKAQERSSEIKLLRTPYQRPRKTASHWLVGLIRCPCGSSMVNSNGYFICSGYAKGRCGNRNGIKASELERIVLDIIESDMEGSISLKIMPSAEPPENAEKGREIAELRLRLMRAKEAYERGIDTIEEYASVKPRLINEIAVLESKKKPAAYGGPMVLAHADLGKLIEDPESRRDTAKRFIREIVWDKNNRSVEITYYAN